MSECPVCGKSFDRLSQHFRWTPEHRQKLTQEQYEVTVGLLMGGEPVAGFKYKWPEQ